jgi:Tfp pilus assembly protein PilP
MKTLKLFIGCGILGLLLPVAVLAQADSAEKSDILVVKKAIHFNNGGRQDPFIDLDLQKVEQQKAEEAQLVPVPSFEERQKLQPGVRGMLIREIKLQGILQKPEERVAFFQGADGKAHFLRDGDDLYDAKVKQITKDSVIFEEYKRYVNKKVEKSIVTLELHE